MRRAITLATLGVALLPVAQASAMAPNVNETGATQITSTSATINATVNPSGSAVSSCVLQFSPDQTYSSSVPCDPPPAGDGTSDIAVSAGLSGLKPGITYHYRVVATNADGTTQGDGTFFDTPSLPPPAVTTGAPTAVSSSQATLTGSVNPNGLDTRCHFEFGHDLTYGYEIPCTSNPGAGGAPVATSGTAVMLDPGTTYHYRLTASNSTGETIGADMVLTVPKAAPAPKAKATLPKRAMVRGGRLTLNLSCKAPTNCHGTVTGKAKVRRGHRLVSTTVLTGSADVTEGQHRDITLRLTAAGTLALRKARHLTVSVKGAGVAQTLLVSR